MASRAVVIRWLSLNEAPFGLFKFISDYLPYFEKKKYIFQYHNKKVWINLYKDWSKLLVRFIRNNLNQIVHTLAGYTVCTIWLRLFRAGYARVCTTWGYFEWPEQNCDQSLIRLQENDTFVITRAPDNFQIQRVITPYFWKWCVFAYFLCTVVLSTSEMIAYMYTFKIMFDTSVIQ